MYITRGTPSSIVGARECLDKLKKEETALEALNFGTKTDWYEQGMRFCKNAGLTEERLSQKGHAESADGLSSAMSKASRAAPVSLAKSAAKSNLQRSITDGFADNFVSARQSEKPLAPSNNIGLEVPDKKRAVMAKARGDQGLAKLPEPILPADPDAAPPTLLGSSSLFTSDYLGLGGVNPILAEIKVRRSSAL